MKEVKLSKWITKTENLRKPLSVEELKAALIHYQPYDIWHSMYSSEVPFIAAGGYHEKGFIMSFHSSADKTPEYKTYEQFHKYMSVQGLECLYIKVAEDTELIPPLSDTALTSIAGGETGIDLVELERKVDEALANETPESLKEWLRNHRLSDTNVGNITGGQTWEAVQEKFDEQVEHFFNDTHPKHSSRDAEIIGIAVGGVFRYLKQHLPLLPNTVGDGWIKVEDRLPENMNEVLIWDGYDMTTGYYRNGKHWVSHNDTIVLPKRVTHWQPLPPAPNQNNEG